MADYLMMKNLYGNGVCGLYASRKGGTDFVEGYLSYFGQHVIDSGVWGESLERVFCIYKARIVGGGPVVLPIAPFVTAAKYGGNAIEEIAFNEIALGKWRIVFPITSQFRIGRTVRWLVVTDGVEAFLVDAAFCHHVCCPVLQTVVNVDGNG